MNPDITNLTPSIGISVEALQKLNEIIAQCKESYFSIPLPPSKIKEGTTIIKGVCILREKEYISSKDLKLLKYIIPEDEMQFELVDNLLQKLL